MKSYIILLLLLFAQLTSSAQSREIQQLLLNVEKLAQFKQILEDMKKGYELVSGGYNTIRDLSQGNFSLHKAFLDGLLEVSPQVRKYKKISAIIDAQVLLLKNYKSGLGRLKRSDVCSGQEFSYLSRVYEKVVNESLENLDELLTVLSAGTLRMSDEERLQEIDRIHEQMLDKLNFLHEFNQENALMLLIRKKAASDAKSISNAYGLKH